MHDKDSFQKFLFDSLHIRGEWVRLNQSFSQAVKGKNYPPLIESLLGETALASVLMTGTLKFEGRLSIHARGAGPITLLTAEATHHKSFRCLSHYQPELPDSNDLRALLGQAQLAITIDPVKGQRYQGIVPLERQGMAACLAHYFELSEQLDTFFFLTTSEHAAYGLMLQKLPSYREIEDQDAWDRITKLAETLGADEFAANDNATLSHRLFHQEDLSLFDAEAVTFSCTCSRERSLASIESLGQEEALDILETEPVIGIDCQFCNAHYEFNRSEIHALFGIGRTH